MSEPVSDALADHCWNRRYSILYRARLSVLYHRKRERFFDMVDKLSAAATAVAATAAVASLLPAGSAWTSAAAVTTAALSLVPLVFNPAMKARHHAELAAEFKRLLADGERTGEHWAPAQCDAFSARAVTLEAGEPAHLGGLVADCQNQLAIAEDRKPAAKLGFFGHLFKHLVDFTPEPMPRSEGSAS